VKRGQSGDHLARWTAAGWLETEKKFRKVKSYRERQELERKLNPELHSQQQVTWDATPREPAFSTKSGTCSHSPEPFRQAFDDVGRPQRPVLAGREAIMFTSTRQLN
jgi:hypothetical protein